MSFAAKGPAPGGRARGGRNPGRAKPQAVDAALEEYLGYLRTEGRSAKTLEKYAKVLGRLAGLLRDRRASSLVDLDLRAVEAYRRARVAAGASPKMVYTETVIVRPLVNFALSRGLIAEDPLRGLKILEPKPTPQPCWTAEEVERILKASPESSGRRSRSWPTPGCVSASWPTSPGTSASPVTCSTSDPRGTGSPRRGTAEPSR